MLKQTNKQINKEKIKHADLLPCLSPWSKGSHLLFTCQNICCKNARCFLNYSILKIHMASLIKSMQGKLFVGESVNLVLPARFFLWICFVLHINKSNGYNVNLFPQGVVLNRGLVSNLSGSPIPKYRSSTSPPVFRYSPDSRKFELLITTSGMTMVDLQLGKTQTLLSCCQDWE